MFVLLKDTNKNIDGYVIQEHKDYDLVLHKHSTREYKKLILKGLISDKHIFEDVLNLTMYSVINFQHENKDFTKYIVEHYNKVFNDSEIDSLLMHKYLRILIVYFVFYKKPIHPDIMKYFTGKDDIVFYNKTLITKIIEYDKWFKTNTKDKEIFFNSVEHKLKKLKNDTAKLEGYNSTTKYEVDINHRYWNYAHSIILYTFNNI